MEKKVSKKPSNDASNIHSISEVKLEQTESALQLASEVAVNRQRQIEQLTKEIELRDQKIRNLEHMIQKMIPKLSVEDQGLVMVTDEEIIVLEQLDRLKYIAKQRQMTPDEVKMLDTLIKNKRLLQGKSTTINAEYEKIKNLSETDLLKLASES